MDAWQELDDKTYNAIWDRFEERFQFHPHMSPKQWPAILEPTPSVTYSISTIYSASGHEETLLQLQTEINIKVLNAFRSVCSGIEKIYALDWNHPGYWFFPFMPFEETNPQAWRLPIFPYSDYYIYIAPDFSFGTFGHPWEETICVFGHQLIVTVEQNLPTAFQEIRRK